MQNLHFGSGLAMAALLTLTLTGCNTSGATEPAASGKASAGATSEMYSAKLHDSLPADIRDRGTVLMTADASRPPKAFHDETGALVGYVPDLSAALSDVLGVEFVFPELAKFDAILVGVDSGRFDSAAFDNTVERRAKYDFVDVMDTGFGIGVAKGNPKNLSIDNLCGASVASGKGDIMTTVILPETSGKCEAAGKQPITILTFDDASQATLSVHAGRADAFAQDAVTVGYMAQADADKYEALNGSINTHTWGFAFKKGSDIAPQVYEAMKILKENGTLTKILGKYGVEDLAIDEIQLYN
ncbi:transporter substrate-binding domain-containing protein [Pseudarthrobacter sp. NPDC055928]|uniref:transporter substrate-binding domain-containing protein n=1 Tax=Pseudarthrobacter sp. NPDC055928 TaxID=3345661 RepID=UPI0035DB9A59